MRGAGPTPPGTEYDNTMMPLAGRILWSASTSFVVRPGGTSGTPDPRSTGTTASSTVSTSPASRSERKRVPPPKSQMSRPGFAFSAATTSRGSSLTMLMPGRLEDGSVREKTTTSRPGMAPDPPCAVTTSYVLRPMTAVSNSLNRASKSIDGSITIQSASPFGPAMKPSRLTATW